MRQHTMLSRDDVIAVRGRRVRLMRGGQGRPLIYFHDAWSQTWLPLHDHLATRYEVLFPIHPGFEGSDDGEDIDRLEELVFHYLDLFEVVQIEPPILMGASFGGWLAAELAVRYSERLRALILVDALGLRVPGAPAVDLFRLDAAQMRTALFAEPTAAAAHTLVPDVLPRESMLALLKARRAFARFAWQFPDDPKLAGYLHRVKCPTLIVWGERDGVVPLRHGEVYRAEVAAAELAILPACGHLPHVEQPAALATTVLNFLARVGAGASPGRAP
jgi:pimeloyl-ACP methyl ester carboxylesterase